MELILPVAGSSSRYTGIRPKWMVTLPSGELLIENCIKGFNIVEGINGLFVGMPSVQNKEGEYYDSVFADKDLRDELEKLAIREYGQDSMDSTDADAPVNNNQEKIAANNPEDVKNKEFDEDDIPF